MLRKLSERYPPRKTRVSRWKAPAVSHHVPERSFLIKGRNDGRTDVPDESDDAELEEQLRQIAARLDPVPQRLLEAAVDSYTWRTIDSDLPDFLFASLAADDAALVRGRGRAGLLPSEESALPTDVEAPGRGPARRITAQLAPPQRA